MPRLDVVVQLAQRDETPVTQLAQERQVVDVHVVHVLLQRRLFVEGAPAQVTGGLVAQLGAVLGVEHAVLERQPAVVAYFAELGVENAAVHALAVVVATADAGEASLAPVALVGADGRSADAERLVLVVYVTLVQHQVVAFLERQVAFLAPEHGRTLRRDGLGAAVVHGRHPHVEVLVQRLLVLERGVALAAAERERRRPLGRLRLATQQLRLVLVAHVRSQVVGALEIAFAQLTLEGPFVRVAHLDVTLEHGLEREQLTAVRTRHAFRICMLLHVAFETATAAQFAAQVAHAA